MPMSRSPSSRGAMACSAEEVRGVAPGRRRPGSAAITLDDIRFRYADDGPLVLAIDHLTIEAGERVAVVGPSGSGKTTLLRLLNGTLTPTSGAAVILGERLVPGRRQSREQRRKTGMIYQDFALVERASVFDNVALWPARPCASLAVPDRPFRRRGSRPRPGRPARGRAAGPGGPAGRCPERRPAPAGGDRPGAGAGAGADPGRRADQQSRSGADRGHPGPAGGRQHAARCDLAHEPASAAAGAPACRAGDRGQRRSDRARRADRSC